MATLAMIQRKSYLPMAGAAISTFRYREHRVFGRTSLCAWEYLRMAEFASIPNRVHLVRKIDTREPVQARLDGKIRAALDLSSLYGHSLKHVDGLDDPLRFRLLPIDFAILSLGKSGAELFVIVFSVGLLTRRMASPASFVLRNARRFGACGKDCLPFKRSLSVVAGPAVETLTVGARFDIRRLGLHRKTNIDMAQSAGKLRTVQPMVEDDRADSC